MTINHVNDRLWLEIVNPISQNAWINITKSSHAPYTRYQRQKSKWRRRSVGCWQCVISVGTGGARLSLAADSSKPANRRHASNRGHLLVRKMALHGKSYFFVLKSWLPVDHHLLSRHSTFIQYGSRRLQGENKGRVVKVQYQCEEHRQKARGPRWETQAGIIWSQGRHPTSTPNICVIGANAQLRKETVAR